MTDQFGEFLDEKGHYKFNEKTNDKRIIDWLMGLWLDFLASCGQSDLVAEKDYFIHKRNLFEVVTRLNKRRAYYFVFHGINKICEYKEIGVLCYWINTLKPFMVVNSNSAVYNCPNEMFSLYIIISTLAAIFMKKRPTEEFVLPDDRTIQDYVYNFKYCDLNREAMIFFVETLAKSYGIGMETNAVADEK